MADDADVAILRTIIGIQHAVNEADPTADAVMKIVVDEARRATGAPAAVVELAEGHEMVYTATSHAPMRRCTPTSAAGAVEVGGTSVGRFSVARRRHRARLNSPALIRCPFGRRGGEHP